MKRVLIILCCVCLIVCLAAPALAFGTVVDPTDYITNESISGDNNIVSISIPAADVDPYWQISNSNAPYVAIEIVDGIDVEIDPDEPDSVWLSVLMRNSVDISSFVDGNTVTVNFTISVEDNTEEGPWVSNVRFNLYYLDSAGNVLNEWTEFYATAPQLGSNSLTFTLDKPIGAVSMRFALRLENVWNWYNPIICTFDSVDFTTSIPSLLRQQQETGKTNKLLDELVNGDHGFDSSGSNFGSEADQLAGAGDQMNNAMGSGMNSLGSMTNSVAFTGTLTTLAGVMDAVFVGHEITICGVTANPFVLLVSIFSIAILLPLGLKFVFRKWGSGGG